MISFLSFGLQEKFKEQDLIRLINSTLLIFTGFTFFAIYGILALIRDEFIHGIVALITSLMILGSIAIIKRTLNYSIAGMFNLTLVIFILLFLFVFSPDDGYVILWFPLVPVLSILILGNKNGNIISLSFLLIIFFYFLLPESYAAKPGFSDVFIMRLSGLYIALQIISSIAEYYRASSNKATEIQLLEEVNKTRLKESFISKISHQIRTPLSNIMLVSHMVNKVNLTDEQRDMMETIIASANNLVNTIENIAEITEVDIESKTNRHLTSFNLHNTISSVIKLFTVQKEPMVEFAFSLDEDLKKQELEGDPVGLKQIFLNLIETILKNKRSGKIQITILANIHSRISGITEIRFEIKTSRPVNLPSWNESQKRPVNKLSGQSDSNLINNLDLNIARKVILHMGGKLHILQTLEKNRVFLFSLPFKSGPKSKLPEEKKLLPGEITTDSQSSLDKLKDINVLLVEDNTINQKIVVLSLKKYIPNINVANNGKEALDKFGTSKYDVILMDIQMPVIDGFVATRKIREIESTTNSHTPIIAITANALHGDREKCLEAGMDDYISKPFQVEVLVAKIKHLLYQY